LSLEFEFKMQFIYLLFTKSFSKNFTKFYFYNYLSLKLKIFFRKKSERHFYIFFNKWNCFFAK